MIGPRLLLLALVLACVGCSALTRNRCRHCGCAATCQKTCRVECETVKVPTVCYDCECEDFCVPGPSQCKQVRCDCGPSCCHKTHKVWIPGCAHIHTRNKLMVKEELKEECVYKWVVVDLCDSCAAGCDDTPPPSQ